MNHPFFIIEQNSPCRHSSPCVSSGGPGPTRLPPPALSGPRDVFSGCNGRCRTRSLVPLLSSSHPPASVTSSPRCSPLMPVPLYVVVTHLQTHGDQKLRSRSCPESSFDFFTQRRPLCILNTHLLVGLVLLFLAVVRLAVGEVSQGGIGQRVKLFPDVVIVAAVGEVEGSVAPEGQEVGVRSFLQQQLDQRKVLLVHGQVQRTAPVPLLLRGGRGGRMVLAGGACWSLLIYHRSVFSHI